MSVTMPIGPRPFHPPGAVLDCGTALSDREWARGFLTLPAPTEPGRLRFVEDVPTVDISGTTSDPLQIFLLDGPQGTPACAIDYFTSKHAFRTGTPPPFPLELVVNRAIIGSDNPDQLYERATVRSRDLVQIFDAPALSPERVAGSGSLTEQRAMAVSKDWSVALAEGAELELKLSEASGSMHWFGELTLRATPRTLEDMADALASMLVLFALLLDRPLMLDRVYATDRDGRTVEYYAQWPPRFASSQTAHLLRLGDFEARFADLVTRWWDLNDRAPDLIAHVAEFQMFRDRHLSGDQVLWLCRCLELYHDFSTRFVSVIRPKVEHRAIVKQVVASLREDFADDHAEWIAASLREANRKRLVDQLCDLVESLPEDVLRALGIGDAKAFAVAAKSTRNYFTHPTGPPPDDVPQGRDLIILRNRLWFVLRGCLLSELGFPTEEVALALRRSGQRHYILA